MDTLIRHPLFRYSVSYRRIMEVQAQLPGWHLLGELPGCPAREIELPPTPRRKWHLLGERPVYPAFSAR